MFKLRFMTYLIAGIFIITIFCNITLAHIVADETKTIQINESVGFQIIEVEKGDLLNYEIHVTNGDRVDVLLMKSNDHAGYLDIVRSGKIRNISYIVNGSNAGIKNESVRNITILESGDYFLVIDNTDYPEGWTTPKGNIEAYLKVDHKEIYEETTQTSTKPNEIPQIPSSFGFELILAGIMIGFAFVFRKDY